MFIRNLRSLWRGLPFSLAMVFILASPGLFAEEEKGETKKAEPEWMKLQVQINTLDAKMAQKRENIARLIEEKEHMDANSPQVKAVIDEMVADHKELEKLDEEYQKSIVILKFRYPERTFEEQHKEENAAVKSLKQMEQDLGVNGRLNRNMKTIRSQYQVSPEKVGTGKESKAEKDPPSKGATESKPKAVDESENIILKN